MSLPTSDQIADALVESLKRGDSRGVDASLRVMAAVDPERASELMQVIKLGIALRKATEEAVGK